jgi:hypothetical protein
MQKKLTFFVASATTLILLTGCGGTSIPNYSGDGACTSLKSLINQLGLMEIQDTGTFYSQIDSIVAQGNTAASTDAKYGELASQVQTFAKVWLEKFPNAVPNYLGTIPLQATSDDFCGTDFENQG